MLSKEFTFYVVPKPLHIYIRQDPPGRRATLRNLATPGTHIPGVARPKTASALHFGDAVHLDNCSPECKVERANDGARHLHRPQIAVQGDFEQG